MIRLELAAVIDGGSIFRSNSYFLEGDGLFICVAFDKAISIFSFIENNQWPNVDAVIESVVSNHPHPAVETLRLKLMQRVLFSLAFRTSPKVS